MNVLQRTPVVVVMVLFFCGSAPAAPLINSYETGDRAPTQRYEEDRVIPGDQGESTTLSFRLALYGEADADLPLVVQVHSWGSNFAGQEDIARWSPGAYNFMMLYFQYKPSTGNEDDWWFGTHWGGACRMWAHEAVMEIVHEVISGALVPTHFTGATIDANRVYMFGHSIGGTGAWQLGLRNPDVFAAVHAHSGFARFTPPVGPFREQFELDIVGTESEGVVITGDDGTDYPARDFSDLSWWLRNYKGASYETPFVFATHGTADDTVPAASGGDLMRTVMDEQHRGFSYYRHAGGHSDENFIRLNWMWNFRKNRSFLSFTNRSGYGAAPSANGVINDLTAFYWDPDAIVDQTNRYEVQIIGSGTADATLRRLQNFNVSPNSSYRFWLNQKTGEGALVKTGADGLLTIPSVPGGSLLIVEPDGGAPPLENPTPSLTINGSGQPAQVAAGDAFQL
ncbi:MAG: prolyl oligopeptidase family serine peptidase, partial [Desulfobacterales bacterium]|nr:prolyl oligopeptidase family serine peptidase [Desulfobacterales bacterium]